MNDLLALYKEKLLSLGILLSPDKEEEYCKKHHMIFKRLSNGSVIIGGNRIVEDSRHSSLNFHMIGGSRFDPFGKGGLSHMMEHLFFSREYTDLAYEQFVDINAYTTNEKINLINVGTLNLDVMSFGLPKILNSTFETLIRPFGFKEERLEKEKGVVIEEYKDFMAEYHNLIVIAYKDIVFGKENPITHLAIGDEESIRSITMDDIESFYARHVVPKNIVASIFSEGNGKELSYLTEKISKFLNDFPRSGEREEIDYTKYSITKDIDTHKIHKIPIKTKNSMATDFIGWTLPIDLYSEEYFAFIILTDLLSHEVSSEMRAQGLGYHAQVYKEHLFPDKVHISFTFTLSSTQAQKTIAELISIVRDSIANTMKNKDKLAIILETEKLHQQATPVEGISRLNFAVEGLNRVDALANRDAFVEIYNKTKISHLEKVLSMFEKQEPIKAIIGDV